MYSGSWRVKNVNAITFAAKTLNAVFSNNKNWLHRHVQNINARSGFNQSLRIFMKLSQLISDNLTIKSECGKILLIFISGVMSGVTDLLHIKVYFEIHDKILSK